MRKRLFQVALEDFGAENVQRAGAGVGGIEEWKALGVVVMHVAEQNRRGDRVAAVGTRSAHEVGAQVDDAGPGVENNRVWPSLDLDAGGVPTNAHGSWPRHRMASPHPPEAYNDVVRHLTAPPHERAASRAGVLESSSRMLTGAPQSRSAAPAPVAVRRRRWRL